MIVYFDTSALVATYVVDSCTQHATKARADARHVATSVLAFPETLAAFSALVRAGALTRPRRERIEARFVADWSTFHRVRLDSRILADVRRVLRQHPLKGADAAHLSSALIVARGCARSGVEHRFACDDRALARAAAAEGLAAAW